LDERNDSFGVGRTDGLKWKESYSVYTAEVKKHAGSYHTRFANSLTCAPVRMRRFRHVDHLLLPLELDEAVEDPGVRTIISV
jgi:hypothetical protein